MAITLYSTWHAMMAHFGVAVPLIASSLVLLGLVAKLTQNEEFAKKLTYPIQIMLLLSMISIILACAGAMIDFPAFAFAASPFFKFKTSLAIVTFFVYAGLYYTILLKKEEVWDSKLSLTYAVALSVIGAFAVSLLGAVGGYLGTGHSVLEFLLKVFGLVK